MIFKLTTIINHNTIIIYDYLFNKLEKKITEVHMALITV